MVQARTGDTLKGAVDRIEKSVTKSDDPVHAEVTTTTEDGASAGVGPAPGVDVDLGGLTEYLESTTAPPETDTNSDGVLWGLGALGAGLVVGAVLWVVGS